VSFPVRRAQAMSGHSLNPQRGRQGWVRLVAVGVSWPFLAPEACNGRWEVTPPINRIHPAATDEGFQSYLSSVWPPKAPLLSGQVAASLSGSR